MKMLPRLVATALFLGGAGLSLVRAQTADPIEAKPTPAASVTPTPLSPAAPASAAATGETPAATSPAPAVETPVPAVAPATPAEAPSKTKGPPKLRRINRAPDEETPMGGHVIANGTREFEAVSLFGATIVEGQVDDSAVSLMGATRIRRDGRVGGAATAVAGRLDSEGDVARNAISVLGSATIDGHVGGKVVTVLGSLNLGPHAVIDGEVVVIGGRINRDPAAVVTGRQHFVGAFSPLGETVGFTTWMKRCLALFRPLAFDANLGWAWMIAAGFLAFYVLLGILFPGGVVRCVETLENRPGLSLLSSALVVLLTPVTLAILAITIVGIPVMLTALLMAGLFGKVVILAWLGRRILRGKTGLRANVVLAVLVGGVVVLLLYTVPVLGFLLCALLKVLGTGVVMFTVALGLRSTKPAPATAPGSAVTPAPATPAVGEPRKPTGSPTVGDALTRVATITPASSAASTPASRSEGAAPAPASAAASAVVTVAPGVPATWSRAGLLVRLGAFTLDGILVGSVMMFSAGMVPSALRFHVGPGSWLLALAVYHAVMWRVRGTTIGGIVCGLKVVRLHQREIDWPTAIVRALASFLSLFVAGLGFIWVAIDDERQSWHDKIAGTAVVRAPKGVSLL